jgi:RNA recognition motif-containing protein
MKLYVGNLPYTMDDATLRGLFEGFGEVHSARVVSDRDSGQSKGFGFVEMNDSEAQSAMSALNGQEHGGRTLRVNEARPQEARTAPSQAKQDRRRIKELERELRRKEKVLAEAAALLVLSKKLEAIFPRDKGEAE